MVYENTYQSAHANQQLILNVRQTDEKSSITVDECPQSVLLPQDRTEITVSMKQTSRSEKIEEPSSNRKDFVTIGYQHFVPKIQVAYRSSKFGEITATVERFQDIPHSSPDNNWTSGRAHFVYHWHPPAPSFRNVRRLH
ncbi:unnamed protein product [Rotaria sp. Silwood1]|nr:unnamed protein product [Rotaria sp. Silwood1]